MGGALTIRMGMSNRPRCWQDFKMTKPNHYRLLITCDFGIHTLESVCTREPVHRAAILLVWPMAYEMRIRHYLIIASEMEWVNEGS